MSRFASFVVLVSFPVCIGCGPDATNTTNVPASSTSSSSSSSGGSTPADAGNTSATPKTLFVREVKADCSGEGPRKCLQVRESESAEWTLFYSSIEGFTYEEGSKYELKVSVESVARPPQDSSSLKYKLVEIVSKQKVTK